MLCLSDFELYSRWVPLLVPGITCLLTSVVQPLSLTLNLNETLIYAVNSDSKPVSDLRYISQYFSLSL